MSRMNLSYIFKGINVFRRGNEDNAYMHLFFLFLVGGGCNQGVLWEMCKWRIANANLMQFHWIFYLAVGKWNIAHPLRMKRSTKTDFWSNRSKFIFHFFMILLPHWYRLGFWISCCVFQIPGAVQVQYLTIIPRARMGYWLRHHEGERNNCFSKI